MGQSQSLQGLDDTITYSVKLYELVKDRPSDVTAPMKFAKHALTLSHPKPDEFWLLAPDGSRLARMEAERHKYKSDAWYTDFVSERVRLMNLTPLNIPHCYVLQHMDSTNTFNHSSVVFYMQADADSIEQKAQAKHTSDTTVPRPDKVD